MRKKSNVIRRISVALDSETYRMLHKLAIEDNTTVSGVVRSAISLYDELNKTKYIDISKLIRYSELVYGGENVIVDIELWACILDKLNENGSEELWKRIENIGTGFGIQYKNKGLVDVKEILNYLEIANWYNLKTNGDSYTLVLRTRNIEKLLSILLKSIFKVHGIPVEIVKGLRRLIIIKR